MHHHDCRLPQVRNRNYLCQTAALSAHILVGRVVSALTDLMSSLQVRHAGTTTSPVRPWFQRGKNAEIIAVSTAHVATPGNEVNFRPACLKSLESQIAAVGVGGLRWFHRIARWGAGPRLRRRRPAIPATWK